MVLEHFGQTSMASFASNSSSSSTTSPDFSEHVCMSATKKKTYTNWRGPQQKAQWPANSCSFFQNNIKAALGVKSPKNVRRKTEKPPCNVVYLAAESARALAALPSLTNFQLCLLNLSRMIPKRIFRFPPRWFLLISDILQEKSI